MTHHALEIIESEKNIIVFTNNGLALFFNRDNGTLENKINLKIDNVNSVYFHKDFILFVTDKARLHIFK